MNDKMLEKEKLQEIADYYREKGMAIIGLNDSQGVDTTSLFFKKGLLEYISSLLENKNFAPIIIDAFSLSMNKTEHIDYFLKANLSVEEIKLTQFYSAIAAIEKVMKDIGLPICLGTVAGYMYKPFYRVEPLDNTTYISSTISKVSEPTIIYSSGVNNLMREVGNNPFAIEKDYKNRNNTPNYNYTLNKSKNPKSLNNVIDGIERNFENILTLNNNADIYTLGAYVPKSLKGEGMEIFRNLVEQYNERLEALCKNYKLTYISTETIGEKYNKGKANFHINTKGQKALANCILNSIYEKKIEGKKQERLSINNGFCVANNGPYEVMNLLLNEKNKQLRDREIPVMKKMNQWLYILLKENMIS